MNYSLKEKNKDLVSVMLYPDYLLFPYSTTPAS